MAETKWFQLWRGDNSSARLNGRTSSAGWKPMIPLSAFSISPGRPYWPATTRVWLCRAVHEKLRTWVFKRCWQYCAAEPSYSAGVCCAAAATYGAGELGYRPVIVILCCRIPSHSQTTIWFSAMNLTRGLVEVVRNRPHRGRGAILSGRTEILQRIRPSNEYHYGKKWRAWSFMAKFKTKVREDR